MRKVIQEGWGWLFSFVNKGVMEGFTKKMTFGQRLAEGEGVSHVGVFRRVFWKGGNPAKALRNSLQGSVGVAEAGREGEGGVRSHRPRKLF